MALQQKAVSLSGTRNRLTGAHRLFRDSASCRDSPVSGEDVDVQIADEKEKQEQLAVETEL